MITGLISHDLPSRGQVSLYYLRFLRVSDVSLLLAVRVTVDRVVHFLHACGCSGYLKQGVQIEESFKLVFVGAVVDHDLESFVVSLTVPEHVAAAMHTAEVVSLKVH